MPAALDRRLLPCVSALVLSTAAPVHATNAELQDLFFAACASPTGALAARCGETDGGLGNLSGDSESSLNPSQGLSGTTLTLGSAQQRQSAVEGDTAARAGAELDFGNWSVLWHLRHRQDEWNRVVDEDEERGYEADAMTFEVGAERRFSDRAMGGVLLSYEQADLDFDDENPGNNFQPVSNAGSIERDGFGVLGYLAVLPSERSFVDFSVAWQQDELDIERRSIFQESNRVVPTLASLTAGDTDATTLSLRVQGGIDQPLGDWTASFSAALAYVTTETDGYREQDRSGTGLAMRFGDADRSATTIGVQASFSRAISFDGGVFVPQLAVGFESDVDTDESGFDAQYLLDAGNNVLDLNADGASDERWFARIGGHFVLRNGWQPFVEASYRDGNAAFESWQIAAGLRVRL